MFIILCILIFPLAVLAELLKYPNKEKSTFSGCFFHAHFCRRVAESLKSCKVARESQKSAKSRKSQSRKKERESQKSALFL